MIAGRRIKRRSNMSFSQQVKQELADHIPETRHCQLAELAAFVRLSGTMEEDPGTSGKRYLTFRPENALTVQKLFTLLKKAFNINIVAGKEKEGLKKRSSVFRIEEPALSEKVFQATTNPTVLKLTCCRKSFLRGAFLESGSISAPEKYYHLEIVSPDPEDAELLQKVMETFHLDAKIVRRKKDYVVYLKEGEQIVTALGLMGANKSFLNLENIRVVKEMRGSVNRMVNCETANLNKTIVSAVKQADDIRYIQKRGVFGRLKPALQEMASVRLEHPDASLAELGKYLSPEIGKSGVNHRLHRLSDIADRLREEETSDLHREK
jgi:DNA-binding protein WhiA